MPKSETPERTRKEEVTSFREIREYARGSLDVDHRDLHPIAGLIEDDRVRHVLAFMAENYDPRSRDMPRSFWETDFARRAVRKHATDLATRAIDEGNLSQVSYFSGLPSYESDVSGIHAINQLAEWLVHSEQTKLIYIAALMGRGKTDFAALSLEVVADHYRRLRRSVGSDVEVPTPEFAANFYLDPAEDDVEVEEITSYPELLEWAEGGSSAQERWFIFDEASSELTAQSGSNAQKVAETMAPFVKKMRKLGVNMIVIGHDRGDVHVAIRSLADFVDKRGLKKASFYATGALTKNREPKGEAHLFDLSGIPPTSWEFDTDDLAEWSWGAEIEGSDGETERITEQDLKEEIVTRAARLYMISDLTQQEVADALSTEDLEISRSAISRRKRELERDKHPTEIPAKA